MGVACLEGPSRAKSQDASALAKSDRMDSDLSDAGSDAGSARVSVANSVGLNAGSHAGGIFLAHPNVLCSPL